MNRLLTRESLYAVKTFAAAMLALGIGFWADLDRPYWAMATVYIASQPHAGTTRSKAIYRLMGTVLGSAAAITLVPNLANAPALLTVALALWVALCLTLSLLDRTPMGYVFMLAGYTAAIIGFPSVDSPGEIWATALARTEEISLGITCATLVSSLVFPRHIAPVILGRMTGWFHDGRQWTLDVLQEKDLSLDGQADRRRLAADVIDIGVLATQLRYDLPEQRVYAPAAEALHARLLMLLPLLSSIATRLAALRRTGGITPALSGALAETARFIDGDSDAQAFNRLTAGIAAREAAEHGAGWGEIMRASLLMRLRELATLFHDSSLLRAHLQARRPGLPELTGTMEIQASALQHRDVRMAIASGLSAGLTIILVCAFWIAAAWPEGAVAAEMAAVTCCFFAAQDDPTPAIKRFLYCTVIAVIVDAVYLFAILPAIDGFPLLVMVLAPTFLLYGWLTARPATAGIGIALAVNGATMLALQGTYTADFPGFANNGIAAVLGMAAAATLTSLIRSVGADYSAWRLVHSNWRSLARAALRRGQGDRAAFAGLILDRIGLVGQISPRQAPNISKLQADLRIGLNIVDLRRARHALPAGAVQVIDDTLDAVAGHYGALAHSPLSRPSRRFGKALLHQLDRAIATLSTVPASQPRQDALLGLVGIRLGLYPDAPPVAAPEAALERAKPLTIQQVPA